MNTGDWPEGAVRPLRMEVRPGYLDSFPFLLRRGPMTDNFQQILQMGQQVQARMSQLQSELTDRTVSCSSGGGMVTVTADGRGRVRAVKVDPSVLETGDAELVEDLLLAAVSEAQTRAESLYEEEMRKMSGGLNLPFQL